MKFIDNILFEDNHVLAVYKPYEVLTQPTHLQEDSLQTQAICFVKEKYMKPFNVFLHPVHRLDKAASGIVIFAKTSKALSRLSLSLKNREWKKTYRLRTKKLPFQKKGTLEHFLVHDEFRARVSMEGKKSVLTYEVDDSGLIHVDLLTGRYHQIRAQFSAIGCPIIGDKKYGGERHSKEGILLQHAKCVFIHPISKEPVEVTLPESLLLR
ncbi:MAG: RluA family pseudouridine synthase [Chlamydiae bacterium]|nr:RluA family pseudouridine synthase [Chlamydiota bacterium]